MVTRITSNKEESEERIVKRLNIVINLLIELVRGESSSREKIKLLADSGLEYKEIASVLNKDKNYVAVELSTLKSKNKKIKGAITIRQAKSGEKMTTLDGKDVELKEDDTVIADELTQAA